jgi:glutamine synthetase
MGREMRPGAVKPKRASSRTAFVERYGRWTPAQEEAAARLETEVARHGIEVVRLSFADQHGILRGKSVVASELTAMLRNGCAVVSTLLAKDTAHRTVYPVFTPGGGFGLDEMTGGGDIIMVPDPLTFRVLPWAEATGWLLCDIHFRDGDPVPFSTRRIARDAVATVADQGFDFVSGLEIEFHLFRLEDLRLVPGHTGQPGPPPAVSMVAHGFQHLTEVRLDQYDPVLQILRRDLQALGLPIRSLEVEYGPSQVEVTFRHGDGIEPADMMVLFRSAAKQIARRHGYHVSFMCRPGLKGLFASGWHLHQSLRDRKTGRNAFAPTTENQVLSPLGRHYMGGLLAHARAASVFSTPTINGYKRYVPNSLAPDRAIWGRDNRGVMIRVIGDGIDDPATRLENRIGEPAANPYLYMASQIVAGMDGVARSTTPGDPAETPYQTDAPALPKSLIEALGALREDRLFRERLGNRFIDYMLTLKDAEVDRFLSEVTDWEHREYFDIF